MKRYKLYQVDSFSETKFLGNPAGVISNADGLSEEQMQKIARELNNSETAFIFSSNDSDESDVHVRFFTPLKEVPICGHATVAAHFVIAKENKFAKAKRIFQKTGAGILPVDIEPIGNYSYNITMTQGEVEFGRFIEGNSLKRLMEALGIESEALIEGAPVQIVSTGHSKVMIGIKNYELLHNLNPDLKELIDLSSEIGCNGYYVFTFDTGEEETLIKGRMFAPAIGIDEDPVTGNANGPLGAYLMKYNLAEYENDSLTFKAKQGISLGREGEIGVEVFGEAGNPEKIKVSGTAVIVFETELTL